MNAVYLDCCATSPVLPQIRDALVRCLDEVVGNAGSRTHEFGLQAKRVTEEARKQVAMVVGAQPDEVVFTSGATEANNLALLGLEAHGIALGHRHVVTTAIEHKAVLEPVELLRTRGFEVTIIPVGSSGRFQVEDVIAAVRQDTLLISTMLANNETGVVQPVDALAAALAGHPAHLHVDAAQGFGKVLAPLRNSRIDFISVSGHKLHAPMGIGALVARRRGYRRPPLQSLIHGGGQERGLRPGTLPVPLVAALGLAAELAVEEHARREKANLAFRGRLLAALAPLEVQLHGDQSFVMSHVVNFSIPGLDSEAVMVALRPYVAISNGSACTSHSYTPSHVLTAMGLGKSAVAGALRISWCHITPEPNWDAVLSTLAGMR